MFAWRSAAIDRPSYRERGWSAMNAFRLDAVDGICTTLMTAQKRVEFAAGAAGAAMVLASRADEAEAYANQADARGASPTSTSIPLARSLEDGPRAKDFTWAMRSRAAEVRARGGWAPAAGGMTTEFRSESTGKAPRSTRRPHACAEFIRTDCAKWLGEIDASQPTVVFEVRDAAGKDTAAVRVSLDGKPWLEKIEVRAAAIDPGEHTVRYEIDGAPAHEESVRIREGDKNRKLAFSFQAPNAAPIDGAAPGAQPAPEEKRSVAPWVVGGVGVAGLIVGGIFGGLTLAAKSTSDAGCKPTASPPTCTQDAHDAAGRGRTFGPVSTVGLVVGGVGVVTSIVLFATRKPAASAATVGMGPVVTPTGARLRIAGSF